MKASCQYFVNFEGMQSIVRPVLVVAVIVVLCQLCTAGRKAYDRNEERELEEIEEVLQLYLKETEEEATVTITEAIALGKKKEVAFKKNQKRFRELGKHVCLNLKQISKPKKKCHFVSRIET